ncbi:MAG: hypothetical protein A3A98_02565 [Candidatus Staskawiczbacteria bacterium RIFCSPLOWO2_01_FULL_40_39]|uniref:Blue (type 1) copper domain-containing protein n=1 Tax=Candidatus Staskawiczbacteria bacterium RIFCSPHIGHO2_01_FULL_39_25 TaxID=1802202 RepID=A0A1G2HPU8_9BACT|nr:MAG: hypothetical protein A2730_02290 [Candidatus Staskawiczbacteria bacterium RIFCSPHIGHO2_01_FULL_39_25]OGZ73632.1 MAG: hypothetical protein A3A98_02565 [Candidatus Staskawiczbacteria bacterium RIFCSPLOWO2_01_FULL_40_39]OGZ74619.1 MAG: hypothetical protein A3I87_01640 [Candidatus Staskawiczbacteria bacterium RIFCSPLOWO2_02_FULL_39_8]
MNKYIIPGIIVIALLAGGYFVFTSNNLAGLSQNPNQQSSEVQQQLNGTVENTVTVVPANHEVIYTDPGYSPSELIIKIGDTVTFKNQSSREIWTGSAMHPVHTAYSGTSLQQHCPDPSNTSFDQCKSEQPGTSWSFTFTKAGTWGYHNHVNASHFGKIIVK